MKEERFDELTQYGYILFMSLFIIIALAGWLLDDEFLVTLSVIPFLYLPVMVCVITMRETNKSRKRKKKKREKERHLRESELLRCRSCDRMYKKEELDISSASLLRCLVCNDKLIPAD